MQNLPNWIGGVADQPLAQGALLLIGRLHLQKQQADWKTNGIDYPEFNKELRIVHTKVPGISDRLATQICRFMQETRRLQLAKVPGVAETLDWALALASLHRDALDPEIVRETLGCLFKDVDDLTKVKDEALPVLLAAATK